MKVTYEFDYFEEREELEKFQKALDYACALWNLTNAIRDYEKHADPGEDAPLERRYEALRGAFQQIKSYCEGYGIWEN